MLEAVKRRAMLQLALSSVVSLRAQLRAQNAHGVSMGHVQLTVRDIETNKRLFALLGGVPVMKGSLELIEFPGMYVILTRGEPSAGSVGSSINHFGFQVRSMQEWLPKWQSA